MILYLDCLRGINGASALAAIVDAGVEPDEIAGRLGSLPGPLRLTSTASVLDGTHVRRVEVQAPAVPDSPRLQDVVGLLGAAELSSGTTSRVRGVYRRVAAAEARIHGTTEDDVIFYEVGLARSVVAVFAFAVAIELLEPSEIAASPLPLGSGTVDTHHGRLPVPAPATLELLEGIPVVPSGVGELVTPTGAAIVAELASSFGTIPPMTVERIGTGTDGARTPPPVTRIVAGSAAVLTVPTT